MKKALLASVLALTMCTSCLGPDNLYRSVKNWNASLSDQDWINEIVYIAFVIVPVYQVALIGDQLIFNTISYWSSEESISDPGEFPGFRRDD